jgi:hypothetical protein
MIIRDSKREKLLGKIIKTYRINRFYVGFSIEIVFLLR